MTASRSLRRLRRGAREQGAQRAGTACPIPRRVRARSARPEASEARPGTRPDSGPGWRRPDRPGKVLCRAAPCYDAGPASEGQRGRTGFHVSFGYFRPAIPECAGGSAVWACTILRPGGEGAKACGWGTVESRPPAAKPEHITHCAAWAVRVWPLARHQVGAWRCASVRPSCAARTAIPDAATRCPWRRGPSVRAGPA